MPSIRFEVDLNGAGKELERLQHPPYLELDSVLLATFATTEARVHVITGELLASGHPTTVQASDRWEGTLSYAGNPGIFELARGERPTKYHGGPGDSHFFFDPVQAPGAGDYDVEHGEGYLAYKHVIETWLEGLCL
jgi:hypothetical protein